MLALALLVIPLSRRITDPLLSLTQAAGHFAAGEFDVPLPRAKRGDEVDVLASAFDKARESIKSQMMEIERMASARQKLDRELSIVRDIQRSMLPSAPSLNHGADRLMTHAALEPAKAVGGDFFSLFSNGIGPLCGSRSAMSPTKASRQHCSWRGVSAFSRPRPAGTGQRRQRHCRKPPTVHIQGAKGD